MCDYAQMKTGVRKLALTAHIVLSAGWLGSVAAYLALAIAGLTSNDPGLMHAVYPSMELMARFIIVPFSLATVVLGLIEALGTPWGLFRYWWVLMKFIITAIGTAVLLEHLKAISQVSSLAPTMSALTDYRDLRIQLVVHAVGGLLILLTATALSVYKPWGLTPYGKRLQTQSAPPTYAAQPSYGPPMDVIEQARAQTPRWAYIVGFHAVGLIVLVLIAHLTGIHPHGH